MEQKNDKQSSLEAKRALLKQRLAKKTQETPKVPLIAKVVLQPDQDHPLSYAQQRLWLLDQIEGGSSHYNMPAALKLSGALNFEALTAAFICIVERHESLRTCFAQTDEGEPIQVVNSVDGFTVSRADLSTLEEPDLEAQVMGLVEQDVALVFDLSADFMVRVKLLVLSDNEHILLVNMHHIASDGWSMGVLISEFTALYAAFAQGQSNPLVPLALQYADYAHWQRNWLKDDVLDKQLDYWTNQLADLPVAHSLPLDHPRPAIQTFGGQTHYSNISRANHHALEQLCQAQGATLFMGLQAAFSVFLARYSNETDIVIGSPIANREQAEIAPLIGFFMNTLVLRSDLADNPTFTALIGQSKQMLLGAYAHQQVPFEQIVEKLQPQRSLSHTPLFQIMLVLQNNEQGEAELPGITLAPVKAKGAVAKFDLCLNVTPGEQGLMLAWDYNTDLFSAERLEIFSRHFERLVEGLLSAPEQSVFSAPMLAENEIHEQLVQWNDTAHEYGKDLCLHQLFEQQAANHPDAIALVFEQTQLTYGELNCKANRLAHYLVEQKQLKPDTLVGICVERSIEMMIGLLGILKAGGAYVPMDPGYPANRLAYILADSGIKHLITQTDILDIFALDETVTPVCLDQLDWLSEPDNDSADRNNSSSGDNSCDNNIAIDTLGLTSSHLAYMIYTSGSTGNPKGVMIPHQNANNFFTGLNHVLGQTAEQRTWLAVTSISFDISILELFWTLSEGDKVVIQPDRPVPVTHTKAMDFSLFYFAAEAAKTTGNKYQLLLDGARFADDNDLAAVWVPERHFASFGDHFPNPSVAAAAVAAVTERVAIRSGSVVLPLHDPIRVAEEWSMVDNLSNGRVEISIASGWHPNDFVLAPDIFQQRHQVLRDNLDTVHQLWQGEGIMRRNGVGNEVEIHLHPSPIQPKLPIWVTAAGSPITFAYAGEIGANLLTHLLGQSIEELGEKIKVYRDALEKAGFARDHGKVALMLHTFVSDDKDIKNIVKEPLTNYLRESIHLVKPLVEEAGIDWEKDPDTVLEFAFERYYQTSGLFGTPQSCLTRVAELQAVGVDEVASLLDFGISTETTLANLPCLAQLQRLCKQNAAKQRLLTKRMDRQWSPFELIERHNVTHMQCTPTYVNDWAGSDEGNKALASLQMLLVGGEAIAPNLASQLTEHVKGSVHNMYGPTETTIWSGVQSINGKDVRIGPPMLNTQFYVVDANHQLVPKGVAGELCIGGDGVARGYFNREDLTKQRFISNPYGSSIGKGADDVIYKTGDLVRRTPKDGLAFLGRLDDQIKLNGFRIELGEIEHRIASCDEVHSALVVAKKNDNGSQTLVAYIKLDAKRKNVDHYEAVVDNVKQGLRINMPDFMMPSAFVYVSQWPLTPNGKINRRGLPEVDGATVAQQHVEPETDTEKALATVWAKVLYIEVSTISALGNFFNLGGHSLLAIRLVAAIGTEFDIEVALRMVFETSDLRAMAQEIDRALLVNETQLLEDDDVEASGWL
jgi:natural product biosynthesis luciferase-like monooxygenase protein